LDEETVFNAEKMRPRAGSGGGSQSLTERARSGVIAPVRALRSCASGGAFLRPLQRRQFGFRLSEMLAQIGRYG